MSIPQEGKTGEIKPSLTIPSLVLLILVTAITGSVGFWTTRVWERAAVEKKSLLLTSLPSSNLAKIPVGIAGTLEFRLAVSPIEKRIIKSLFSFNVAVRNQSNESVENLSLHLFPPSNVKLIDPPQISTRSKILADYVARNRRVSENEIIFDIDLLGPRAGLSFTYAGYSEEAIDGFSQINIEARKKGWEIHECKPGFSATFSPGLTPDDPGYTDYAIIPCGEGTSYSDNTGTFLSKRVTGYNGGDVVSLFFFLVMITCGLGLTVWLLTRALFSLVKQYFGVDRAIKKLTSSP